MKVVNASYDILSDIQQDSIYRAIELAGRTCYKSEDKITDNSAAKFISMIINNGHESVLEHEKLSIRFICDRGVSHELVRHRIASFSQESTRYCNYSKDRFDGDLTYIRPCWFNDDLNTTDDGYFQQAEWYSMMETCSRSYVHLIQQGWTPQQARAVLPNSLKTEIVVTANIREWREILRQRTSKAAHPQMRELMIPLLKELQEKLPELFNDIKI